MKRILALFLVAVTLFAVTACSQGSEVKGDKDQTALETEIPSAEPTVEITQEPNAEPTEAPTEEPTETTLPEGWYIDPDGIIPLWVEILVPDEGVLESTRQWCITRVDGEVMLQYWGKTEGLIDQWEVPKGFLSASFIQAAIKSDGSLILRGLPIPGNTIKDPLVYYELKTGKYMYFEANSDAPMGTMWLIATVDGKAIIYYFGNGYYEMHDYDKESLVEIVGYGDFSINGHYMRDGEEFEKVPLSQKDF